MIKSFHLGIAVDFQRVSSSTALEHIESSLHMAHSDQSYWKRLDDEAIIQEFDGQQGFLYHIDIKLSQAKTIPLMIERSDLHILYVLSSDGAVHLHSQADHMLTSVGPDRARYLYLPEDGYRLQLPKGHTQLFGLYFRGTIFRQGNDRPYAFLHPLIQAHRSRSALAHTSIDFRVGPRTKLQIEMTCKNLQAQQLHNEGFIYAKLIQLIELSLDKVHEEQSKAQYAQRIATNARNLLALYIEDEGQCASIRKLAGDLHLEIDTINRYHRYYFGTSLSSLRHQILVDKAKEHLRSGLTATETAYALNYSCLEAFSRFFAKHYGKSVKEFIIEERKSST